MRFLLFCQPLKKVIYFGLFIGVLCCYTPRQGARGQAISRVAFISVEVAVAEVPAATARWWPNTQIAERHGVLS